MRIGAANNKWLGFQIHEKKGPRSQGACQGRMIVGSSGISPGQIIITIGNVSRLIRSQGIPLDTRYDLNREQ
jgi:hypothetical protein